MVDEDQVLKYIGRFIQYYRENAKYLERTHGFLVRIGIDKIKEVVVADSEGIGERLDSEIAASKAAYKDPWKDSWLPANAKEFASVLPILS